MKTNALGAARTWRIATVNEPYRYKIQAEQKSTSKPNYSIKCWIETELEEIEISANKEDVGDVVPMAVHKALVKKIKDTEDELRENGFKVVGD